MGMPRVLPGFGGRRLAVIRGREEKRRGRTLRFVDDAEHLYDGRTEENAWVSQVGPRAKGVR